MQLPLDAESEARIERIKAHLPEGKDLALLVLKGHLLVEEGLNELIAAACAEPKYILDGKKPLSFNVKTRVARALCGHMLHQGLWPLIDTLNMLRNDLAHNLDSPKFNDHLITFMRLRKEKIRFVYEESIDPSNVDAIIERFRSDVSLLISQLNGGALAIRTLVKRLAIWKQMADEMNKA